MTSRTVVVKESDSSPPAGEGRSGGGRGGVGGRGVIPQQLSGDVLLRGEGKGRHHPDEMGIPGSGAS